MTIVQFQDVSKVYALGKTEVRALDSVSLSIQEGDFIALSGPSGSGKSTVLNLIGCIDTPSSGEVTIKDVNISSLNDRSITSLRHKVLGFIFQSFNLIPVLTVRENIEFPLLIGDRNSPYRNWTVAERNDWIDHLIDAVGLHQWRNHRPNELSGGQRQRVAIARALATKPDLVMADEPTANLDSKTGEQIIDLMRKMNQELGTTFVFSTHDSRVVDIADHVIFIRDGQVIDEAFRNGDKMQATQATEEASSC